YRPARGLVLLAARARRSEPLGTLRRAVRPAAAGSEREARHTGTRPGRCRLPRARGDPEHRPGRLPWHLAGGRDAATPGRGGGGGSAGTDHLAPGGCDAEGRPLERPIALLPRGRRRDLEFAHHRLERPAACARRCLRATGLSAGFGGTARTAAVRGTSTVGLA